MATAAGSFYPNPVLNTLTYQLSEGGQAHTLTVVDLTGRQVLARTYGNTGEQNTVDLSALHAGLYLVRLAGPAFSFELKISKQ